MSAIKYRPEVDGLRAVAILAVIAFHIFPRWVPGGFAGVDVFFVISGYLITSIIFEECQQGVFSFRRFYIRRLKRLFPAMAGVLISVLAVGAALNPFTFSVIKKSVIYVLLLSGNIYMWRATGDYWGADVEHNPLLHTWSLAVEEQFYMLFPITLVILFKYKRTFLLPVLAALTVLSFVCCIFGTNLKPAAAFYLLPTRGWELAIGCLLALYPRANTGRLSKHRWAGVLAGGGLLMIGISYFTLQGGGGFPGYKAMLPTVGALLVIGFTGGTEGLVSRILQGRLMVFLGKASYSLYLWHWPVIAFFNVIDGSPTCPSWLAFLDAKMVCVVLSVGLALASYRWIERPLRTWNGTPMLCAIVFVGMFAAMGLAKPGSLAGKHGTFEGARVFSPITVRGRLYSVNQKIELSESVQEKYKHVRWLLPEKTPTLAEGIVKHYGKSPIDVMVMGDSHSSMFAPLIDDICRDRNLTVCFFCADGVSPDLFRINYAANEHFGTAADLLIYDDARKRILDSRRPKVVVWIQKYDSRRFNDLRASLQYIVDRSTCVFIQQAPVLNIENLCTVDVFAYYRDVRGIPLDRLNIVEKRGNRLRRGLFEQELLGAFQGNRRFRFLDTNKSLLTPDGKIRWWDGVDTLYYIDDDHLSERGVQLFRESLEEIIVEEVARGSSQ